MTEIDITSLIVRMVEAMPNGACPVGLVFRTQEGAYSMAQVNLFGTDFPKLLKYLSEAAPMSERRTIQ